MIKYKIRGSDWLTFPLIIVKFNHFFIQPAPGLCKNRHQSHHVPIEFLRKQPIAESWT